jgi:hypothetical protein
MEIKPVVPPEQVPAASAVPAAGGDAGSAALEPLPADLEKRLDALLESRLEAVEARRREAEREGLMQRFAAEHPDFRQLAASGVLEEQKRLAPLLDDVGAYFAHHLAAERQDRASAIEAARKDAVAEAEAGLMDRLRTKGLARTLSAAPAAAGRGQGVDPDLAAPEKFGGIHTVLAARLAARRQSAGV